MELGRVSLCIRYEIFEFQIAYVNILMQLEMTSSYNTIKIILLEKFPKQLQSIPLASNGQSNWWQTQRNVQIQYPFLDHT